jgi:hypothetical protein
MEERTCQDLPARVSPSPEARLDAFRAHPEWDDLRRDEELERLVTGHSPDELRAAIGPRLHDLGGNDAEPVLRLVEVLATPDLLEALALALRAQPGLAPERAWEALALLEDAGRLASYPDLAERWDELGETLDDEDASLEELASQIEDDPEGLCLALQGLAAVEPDVRAQIIAGLGHAHPHGQTPGRPGPRLIEFLRLLAFAHDPRTRAAALEALANVEGKGGPDGPALVAAWSMIAGEHPDPEVAATARRWMARRDPGSRVPPAEARPRRPLLVRSLVTAVDGDGRATVVLSAVGNGGDDDDRGVTTRTSAAFTCDVERGVVDVFGQEAAAPADGDSFVEAVVDEARGEYLADAHGLAVGLLQGCLLLCGPETTPALRYWLEATLGPHVPGHPFPTPWPDGDPKSSLPDEMAARAGLVLDSCPSWRDASALTHELAEEISLREGDSPPDPRRDAGAYRYLFEHRLRAQLERYRRMLFWMASFWQAAGTTEQGRSALALAAQLSDEQHAVAGHPFTVALSTRSLAAALANLRAGDDPRRALR